MLHIEDKLNSVAFRQALGHNISTQKSVQHSSTASLFHGKNENLNEFALEVDRALKEMEDRLLQIISQKSEEHRYDSRQMEVSLKEVS